MSEHVFTENDYGTVALLHILKCHGFLACLMMVSVHPGLQCVRRQKHYFLIVGAFPDWHLLAFIQCGKHLSSASVGSTSPLQYKKKGILCMNRTDTCPGFPAR